MPEMEDKRASRVASARKRTTFALKSRDGASKASLVIDEKPSKIDVYKEPLYNQDGTRNEKVPFCLFVSRKQQEERREKRKSIAISNASRKEKRMFEVAIKKLKAEKQTKIAERCQYLKSLTKARAKPKKEVPKKLPLKTPADGRGDDISSCPISCQRLLIRKPSKSDHSPPKKLTAKDLQEMKEKEVADRLKVLKKAREKKQLIKYPPVKTKKWEPPKTPTEALIARGVKPKVRPVIVIPPIKTKKWIPEPEKPKKKKIVIEYPPVKLRSKPPLKQVVKKVKPRMRLDKVFYPVPSSTLGKRWHAFKCLSKIQILRGTTSQYSKKFGFMTNGKQSTFIAAVALAFAKFHSMANWKSQHIDEIILYGDINCRKQIRKFRHQNVIKPCEIANKIYLKRAKVFIELCERIEKGCFEPSDTKEMRNKIEDVLKQFSSLLIAYCGQTYAIWSEENAFYIFNSEDTDDNGNLVERTCGAGCAIRSGILNNVIDYLISNFKATKQRYEIFSFKVDKVIKIEEELAKLCPSTKGPEKILQEDDDEVEEPETPQVVDKPKTPKSGLAAILFRHQPEPIFGDSFQKSSLPHHGYLIGANFLQKMEENRAPFISSVAVLMLRICKSSLWQSSTLSKIFNIGHNLFIENVENHFKKIESRKLQLKKAMEPDPLPQKDPNEEDDDDDDDEEDEFSVAKIRDRRRARMIKPKLEAVEKQEFPITKFEKLIVKFGNFKFEMNVENIILGKVMTRKAEEISLKIGLENLFKKFDHGLILGPETVAVWREQNYFFMFDPNRCQGYTRADEFSDSGNSCLHWFKNLSDLVQMYVNNLKKDQRSMIYKICKIESKDFIDKARDWQNFKAINSQKWILSGKISESSDEFNVSNRGHQSTCISLIALAKSKEQGIISWSSQTINEIVRLGDEFYTGCVIKLKEKEKFVSPNLELSEIGTEFQLENAIADFTFEESAICGKLNGNDGNLMTIHTGLEVFFKDDEMGVVMTNGVSYGVMKYDETFFLFDSHDRDPLGRNLRTLDPTNICNISGSACVLRFKFLSDLASHLLSNIEIGDVSTYTINKVEVILRTSEGPCLYAYKPFGKNSNAAMLRAFDDCHEDVESFKSDVETKTLCNLFAALCFTRIIQPNQWSRMDVNEIMKIGYKLLCNAANSPDDIWEKLSEIEICGINLRSEKSEAILGIFKPVEKILPEIDRENETIEENIQIAEIERRETLKKSRASSVTVPTLNPPERNSQDGDQSSIFPPLDSKAAERLSLMEILNSWNDQKEILAILSSSLFNIAIFKMNRVFFVFDPKASSDFGGLIQKRHDDFITRYLKAEYSKLIERFQAGGNEKRLSKEEEFQELLFGRPVVFGALTVKPSQHVISMNENEDDPIMISEKGAAYVAWFTTPELAFEHILSKIPDKFRNQSFTMHEFKIVKEVKEVQLSPWNNFTPISENHWILRATFSQNDTQFPSAHRNNQDLPNCLMSLMFARLCNATDWNSTVLEVILKLGDRLFKKSLECQTAKYAVPVSKIKLELGHLVLPVFIRPFIINVTSELIKRDMMIKLDDKTPLENFKEVLNNFLTSSDAGLLISKKYHVAIWKGQDEGLMMFDPHDIGPDGTKKSTGFACLQRFLNHLDLADNFFTNIKDIDGLNEFELIKINLIMDDYKDGKDEDFENQVDEASLPKTILAKSTQLQNDGVPMTICYAIATLCVSRSLDPEYYTPDIIDRIILLGNELSHECLMNDEICFKDFDLGAKSSCPDEINWNFQLNDTFANIQMDIFQRGIISKDPSPLPNLIFSLEEFFNFYSIGLLITCEFITAMWKEDGKYFIFYSCPIDERGRRNEDMKAAPGLVSFNTVGEVYSNLLSNTTIEQAPFELRICSIAMSDLTVDDDKCGGSEIKKIRKTEIIMPAVAMREVESLKEKIENLKNQEMIEALKKKKTEGYLKYKLGGFICGCLSKNSKTFNELSRNFHSSSICVICAAMSAIREPYCWTQEIIDAIISSGNNLYIESSLLRRKKEIEITEIVSALCIGDHKISVKVESCMKIAQKKLRNEHLMALFDTLFGCRKICYITRKFDCWLLMKFGKFIFLFDPLGIVFPGKKKIFNRATLYRLDSTEKSVQQLMECIKDVSNDEEDIEFDVGGIHVKMHQKRDKTKPKPQELKKVDSAITQEL